MSPSQSNPEPLGSYELLEVLDNRPEGRVYKARCLSDSIPGVSCGELVALKRFKAVRHGGNSGEFRRRGEALRALQHPGVVPCKDFFICQSRNPGEQEYCLVTEFLEGETLRSLLARKPAGLRWPEARDIFLQVLAALQYVHDKGAVHSNLSLSAFQVSPDQAVTLMDFGLASRHDRDPNAREAGRTPSGSLDYMAPEFARLPAGFVGDEQSDVFSLGVCIYHALTGSLPYPALSEDAAANYLERWLGPGVPEPDLRRPAFRVLRRARAFFSKCLEPNREKRFRSIADLLEEFCRITYRRLRHGEEVYEFYEWLGQGGFGEVFHARRLRDGRDVAVKRLFSAAHSARFLREARILRDSSHPNLAEYVDFIEVRLREDEREYYLVLEFLEGMPSASLRHCIKTSESGMDPTFVLRLFSGYLDCLEHLHQKGIIHRDIKPGNLYVPKSGPENGKVFDLGIAYDEEGTRTQGQVLGTLDYMPPEFASQGSGRGSPQSDIYSLGTSLYQALTKKLPFPRLPDKDSEAWAVFFQRAQRPIECTFDHPVFKEHPELVPVLRRTLAPTPAQRHASAKVMRDEIQAILEKWYRLRNKDTYDKALASAQTELNNGDFDQAEQQARRALDLWPADATAAELLSRVLEARQNRRSYDALMAAAWEALERDDYEAAESQASRSLSLKPRDSAAVQLLALAREAKAKGKSLGLALAAARAALDHEKFNEAESQVNHALKLDPGNPVAAKLLTQVEEARLQEKMFEAALAAARSAFEKASWDAAEQQVRRALQFKPDDCVARQLLSHAQERYQIHEAYEATLDEAKRGFDGEDYATAEKKASRALELKPGDLVATQLLHRARELGLKRQAFDTAMSVGRLALEKADFDEAERQAEQALAVRPANPAAAHMLSQAKEGRQNHQIYESAVALVRAALEREDPDEAENQAQRALECSPGDLVVARLLSQTRELRRLKRLFDAALGSAKSALAEGDFARAEEYVNRGVDLRPNSRAAEQLRGEIQDAKRKKKLFDASLSAARAALVQENFDEAEIQAARALELRAGDSSAAQLLAQAQEARVKRKLFDGAIAAARLALEQENFGEAETQAAKALDLRPGDSSAALLASQVRGRKRYHRLYQASMAAGEVAFAEEDYEEAERQAERALGFRPESEAPMMLLSQVRARRPRQPSGFKPKSSPFPPDATSKRFGQFDQEDSTAATRPANLDSLSEKLKLEGQSRPKPS